MTLDLSVHQTETPRQGSECDEVKLCHKINLPSHITSNLLEAWGWQPYLGMEWLACGGLWHDACCGGESIIIAKVWLLSQQGRWGSHNVFWFYHKILMWEKTKSTKPLIMLRLLDLDHHETTKYINKTCNWTTSRFLFKNRESLIDIYFAQQSLS